MKRPTVKGDEIEEFNVSVQPGPQPLANKSTVRESAQAGSASKVVNEVGSLGAAGTGLVQTRIKQQAIACLEVQEANHKGRSAEVMRRKDKCAQSHKRLRR